MMMLGVLSDVAWWAARSLARGTRASMMSGVQSDVAWMASRSLDEETRASMMMLGVPLADA
jgi:hypothetical protein